MKSSPRSGEQKPRAGKVPRLGVKDNGLAKSNVPDCPKVLRAFIYDEQGYLITSSGG